MSRNLRACILVVLVSRLTTQWLMGHIRPEQLHVTVSARVNGDYLALRERLRTLKVFTKDQCFYIYYHKFSIKSYVFTHPQHMIYGDILKIIHFYHFDSDPRFSRYLLYVRWKYGVTSVRRCFRGIFQFVLQCTSC